MRKWLAAVVLFAGVTAPAAQAGQAPQVRHLELSFDEQGRVTLAAQGVTVRDILTEWARQGGSRFVNIEKLSGPALSMPVRFENQPELEVLQSLLATAAGIIVAPKLLDAPGRSRMGTVVILASSSPSAAPGYAPQRQVAPPPVTPGSPTDELPPVRPPALGQDPAATPGAPAAPSAQPNRPGVFQPVQIVPIAPAGRGGGGATPPTTTGRGGGGGGGRLP
jgi:hypothetical protein